MSTTTFDKFGFPIDIGQALDTGFDFTTLPGEGLERIVDTVFIDPALNGGDRVRAQVLDMLALYQSASASSPDDPTIARCLFECTAELALLDSPPLKERFLASLPPTLVSEKQEIIDDYLDKLHRPYDVTLGDEPGPYGCMGSGTQRIGQALVITDRFEDRPPIVLSVAHVLAVIGAGVDHQEGIEDLSPAVIAMLRNEAGR